MENNDYIKRKREELIRDIKDSEKELRELRDKCSHKETKVKDVNPEPGSSELRVVCKACERVLRFPTNQDLKDNGYMS